MSCCGDKIGGWPMTRVILKEIVTERARQDDKFGEQNHTDGTGMPFDRDVADWKRQECDRRHRAGIGTWRDILDEEIAEAYAETDPANLRDELIQVAAVAVAWAECIDRRADQ